MSYMFMTADFNGDISKWDTAQVTDMQTMFFGATSFNGDISQWNTAKVTNMQTMFYDATAFNGDISQWNTAKVTNMMNMFYNSGFTRTLCGGAWESLTGYNSAFKTPLGTSTARYGCCPTGKFMSNPFVTFSEASSCSPQSPCSAGKYGTNVPNDETSMCTNCVAGKSNLAESSGISSCQNCQAGQSSIAGALCQDCQAGQSSIAGALCQDCQAGQFVI